MANITKIKDVDSKMFVFDNTAICTEYDEILEYQSCLRPMYQTPTNAAMDAITSSVTTRMKIPIQKGCNASDFKSGDIVTLKISYGLSPRDERTLRCDCHDIN